MGFFNDPERQTAVNTGGGICSVSPSDSAGSLDNILARLAALERAVSELSGSNVEAGSLSEITGQVGWVNGITYGGVGGWSRTPSGTLVPPPGFAFSDLGWTLSDGSTYSAGAWTSAGTVTFGIKPDGTLGGTSVDAWNASAGANPASALVDVTPSSGTVTKLRGFTVSGTPSTTGATVIAATAGLYLAMALHLATVPGGGATYSVLVNIKTSEDVDEPCGQSVTNDADTFYDVRNYFTDYNDTSYTPKTVRLCNLQLAGSQICAAAVGSGSTPYMFRLHVVRLGNHIP